MIIICPECSTKFNVDSDRIPDQGTKVRCARCKHVFLVEKLIGEEAAPNLETAELAQEEPASDLSEQQASPQPLTTDKSFSETTSEESDFSYDKFQELDSSTTEEDTFTFGAESDPEYENIFADNHEDTIGTNSTVDEDFSFADSSEDSVSTIEKVFSTTEENKTTSEPTAAEEVTSKTTTDAKPGEKPELQSPPEPEKKGGPISSIIRILLLLILGILIIGGVFVYMNGTDQLNQTIQQLLGQQSERPVQTGQITLGELEGKFIQNEKDGELFLIHGKAINNYAESRAGIQVKGVIFDQNNKPLFQKTVFCGNSIDDEKLLTLPFSELEKIMGNQFGAELSNMKIESKKSIPFMIIFKDLPQNLSEFSVKVTASKPATE